MLKKLILLQFILLASFSMSFAQEDAAKMEEQQKAWQEFMTPGEPHQFLAKMEGEWKSTNYYWMSPGSEPQVSEGTSDNKMIMGGRYMISDAAGTVMGMTFHGQSVSGFDNSKKIFFSTWIDDMGTGLAYAEGTWNKKSGEIVMTGKMTDPVSGGDMKFREVFKIIDENNHLMEMYMIQGDQEFKSMEIKYERK